MAEFETRYELTAPQLIDAWYHQGFQREADEVQFYQTKDRYNGRLGKPRPYRHLPPGPLVIEVVNKGTSEDWWGGVGELWVLYTDDPDEAAYYAFTGYVPQTPLVTYTVPMLTTFRQVLNPARKYTVARWRGSAAIISVKAVGLIQHPPSVLKLAAMGGIVPVGGE